MDERPLWAPWRIEYIRAPKPQGCIFCSAASDGSGSDLVIDRAERCFTMLNAFPYGSGHLMISPRRHLAELEELDTKELVEIAELTRRAVRALRGVMSPDGFNLGLNLGTVAGAGLADHLHVHVVPRWQGDANFMPVIADTRVVPEALSATADALRSALEGGAVGVA